MPGTRPLAPGPGLHPGCLLPGEGRGRIKKPGMRKGGGPRVTKEQLVKAVAAKAGVTRREAARAVGAFQEAVREALARGEEVRLVGFGAFLVRERAARKGRNIRTGEEIVIPPKRVVAFRPGSGLTGAVDR